MTLNVASDSQWMEVMNRGAMALNKGEAAQAVELFQQAIRLNPVSVDSQGNLGEAYRMMRDYARAIEAYDRAIALDPRRCEARINRGEALRVQGRLAEAMAAWQFVVDHAAEFGRPPAAGAAAEPGAVLISYAYNNMGIAYHDQGEFGEALRCHRLATQWDPDNMKARKNYLFTQACSADADPVQILELARKCWAASANPIMPANHVRPGKGFRPLRVGFVSSDFRLHSVAYFLIGLFTKYDRSRHQFYGYANVEIPDGITAQLRHLSAGWRSIVGASDKTVADMIAFDKIDILIDLGGFTGGARLEIFAYRAAPVQVAYLGCPITTGCPQVDWRITDALADPPGMTEGHFSERLWRLERPAWCYHPLGNTAPEEEAPVLRKKSFTFGSFNSLFKVTPPAVELWADILRNVPDSRLMLKGIALSDEGFAERLRRRFTDLGVEGERVVLLPRHVDANEHLASYREIDLALDTFPYNGTTTTCEALWMGVPVLTVAGQTHYCRVGHSLLSAVGLAELSVPTMESYRERAIRLGRNPDLLVKLCQGLRGRLEKSPLMDETRFAEAFCAALRGMWRQWVSPLRG